MLTDPTNAAVGLTIGVGVLTVLVMWIVSYRYRMIWFLLMDHPDASPWQLLRTSSAMTQGHRWELFLLDLSFLPWFLLCRAHPRHSADLEGPLFRSRLRRGL